MPWQVMHEAFEGEELHALLPVVEPGYAALNAARWPEVASALVEARIPQAPQMNSAMTCKCTIRLAMTIPPNRRVTGADLNIRSRPGQ